MTASTLLACKKCADGPPCYTSVHTGRAANTGELFIIYTGQAGSADRTERHGRALVLGCSSRLRPQAGPPVGSVIKVIKKLVGKLTELMGGMF